MFIPRNLGPEGDGIIPFPPGVFSYFKNPQLLCSISKVPKSTGLKSTEVQKYRGSASKVLGLIIYFIILLLFFRAGEEICG